MMGFIVVVLIYVGDFECGFDWYEQVFVGVVCCVLLDIDFEYLDYVGVMLEVVFVDVKVGLGVVGSVIYWQVFDFVVVLVYFCVLGVELYCGLLDIEGGECMGQVCDFWGNFIGLWGF